MLKPSGVESAKQSPRGSSPGEGRGAELFSTSVTVQFGSVEGHLGKAVARILWGRLSIRTPGATQVWSLTFRLK